MGYLRFLLALCLMIVPAIAQMPPIGELHVAFTPSSKVVLAGDSIRFEAGRFEMDIHDWTSGYTIRKISVSAPDSFLVLVNSHLVPGEAFPLATYDGPGLHIPAKEPGVYVIRFDSTSEFQADMADSAVFTAQPSTGIRSPSPRMEVHESEIKFRLNGQRVFHPEATPAFTR